MTTRRKSCELDIPALDLRRFDWDRENNTLVAECSQFNSDGDAWTGPAMHRLYNDACDYGIAIASPSGVTKRFAFAGRDQNGDDVAGWRFNPVDGIGPNVLFIND